LKFKEYEPLVDGTVLMLDDGFDPTREIERFYGYIYQGAVILVIAKGSVSQDNASRAAAQMVGTRAIAGPRRVTLEHRKIETLSDAEDLADDFIFRLNRVLKHRASRTDKLDARSGTTMKRSYRK